MALFITWAQTSKYARTERNLTFPPMHKPCVLNRKHYIVVFNKTIIDKISE